MMKCNVHRYLLRALDLFWHEDCLKCGCCDCRLGEVGSTLYTRANLILCRRDYLRLLFKHSLTFIKLSRELNCDGKLRDLNLVKHSKVPNNLEESLEAALKQDKDPLIAIWR